MSYETEDLAFRAGLNEFTRAAHEYIEHLHDPQAKRFALRYMVYLQAKARRMPHSEPGAEPGLSGPDRSLIRIYIRNLYDKHLRGVRRRRAPRGQKAA